MAGLDLEVKDLEVVCSSKVKMKTEYLGAKVLRAHLWPMNLRNAGSALKSAIESQKEKP